MTEEAANIGRGGGNGWRIAGWSIAGLLLLLPLVVGAPWTASDFVFAGVMIGGVGVAFELFVRMSCNLFYRAGAGFALAAVFAIIWSSAAVGMIGEGDHPLNLMFVGVIGIALLGALLVRFRAEGMARVMLVAAVAQAAAGAIGTSADLRGGIISATFALFWLVSSMLFARAAREARTGASNAA